MELVRLIKERVQRPPPLSPAQFKSARPVRNPLIEFEVADDGSVLLTAPLATVSTGFAAMLARWAKTPQSKKIELEPVGGFVWMLCDGKTSFEGISKKLRERFKLNRMEADASLNAFLKMLSQRGLITVIVKAKK